MYRAGIKPEVSEVEKMVVTIDWFEYYLYCILKEVGCPILIGIAVLWVFFRIRERNINKREE